MSKCNLLFYCFRRGGYPNLGVAYLAAVLRRENLVAGIQYIDATMDLDAVARQVCSARPHIVGLSATSADFPKVQRLAKALKDDFGPLIILGGPHISSVPETLPDDVDIAALGESEETIVDLMRLANEDGLSFDNLRKIPGLAFRDSQGDFVVTEARPVIKDLDALPLPARDLFPADYWKGSTSILTSRGCPYRCAFCQVVAQHRFCRYHGAARVVAELEHVVAEYGVTVFDICDDLFVVNRKRIPLITEGLRQRGLLGTVRFALNARANLVDDELVAMCKEMGAFIMTMGLESMSPRTLGLLKNKVTVDDNARAVDTINRGGLKVGGLYMLGTPGETLQDLLKTMEYVVDNRDKFGGVGGMVLCVTSPLPKTPLWDLCVATRRIDPDLSRFDWEKLKVAVGPGELDSNAYVGDLDRELFREVFGLFHKVFHDPAYIESREMRLQALARLRTLADLSPSTKVA